VFFLLGRKSKARRVEGGQLEKRKCPECEETTAFREVVVQHDYTAFIKVKLFDSESEAFACDACGAIVDLEDTLEPELSDREKRLARKQDSERIKAQAKELEKKAKELEAAQRKHDREIDDELAALKKQLGL
jgi:hypothetical protein